MPVRIFAASSRLWLAELCKAPNGPALTPDFTSNQIAIQGVYRWREELEYRGKVQSAATTALASGRDECGRLRWTVLPHTGRPHQIRRHFARYLVPLWGDQAYAPGVYDQSETLGLTCVAYRCRHPVTGQRLEVNRGAKPLDEVNNGGENTLNQYASFV